MDKAVYCVVDDLGFHSNRHSCKTGALPAEPVTRTEGKSGFRREPLGQLGNVHAQGSEVEPREIRALRMNDLDPFG